MTKVMENATKMHNPIADFTITRTYSRIKCDKNGDIIDRETKDDIFRRVVFGTFSLLEERLRETGNHHIYEDKLADWALQMYSAMWNRRFTPPGRGLWSMGTELINHDKMGFPLVNCTFITSSNINEIKWEFFHYVMDTLMLGVGVGYDTRGKGSIKINIPSSSNYKRYDDYYLLVDQLKQFRDTKFVSPTGEPYIDYEIDYINMLEIAHHNRYRIHEIKDSREGWCEALCELLKSYMLPGEYLVVFDYRHIRPEGSLLKKFGGRSSGPKPLAELLSAVRYILQERYLLKTIDELFIIDVCNIIARTVVAGNVRRSSQICLSTDADIIECKCYSDPKYKYRSSWGWASNNSFIVEKNLDKDTLKHIMSTVTTSGEPGLFFVENAQKYGRIIDGVNNLDCSADGTNPCGEVTLCGTNLQLASIVPNSAGGETCNLSENIPSNYNYDFTKFDVNWDLLFKAIFSRTHPQFVKFDAAETTLAILEEKKLRELIKEFVDDLFISVLYPKIVTLVPLHWKSSNKIQENNRRIGVSMTGISVLLSQMGLMNDKDADKIHDNDDHDHDGYFRTMYNEKSLTFKRFAVFLDLSYRIVDEYDKNISAMLKIPQSIKKRTVKPSGTVSICNGVPSGMHFPYSQYYMRRVRINKCENELIDNYRKAGYIVEDVADNPNTVAITFPVKMDDNVMARDNVNVDLQFKILTYLQYYWSDNQVSCTITFRENEVERLEHLINYFSGLLKGLSCYPYFDEDKYYNSLINARVAKGTSAELAKREIYRSLPNERITKDEYLKLLSTIKPVNGSQTIGDDNESDMYCDGDSCVRR